MHYKTFLNRQTSGFSVFRQRHPCSELLCWCSNDAASFWSPWVSYIVIPELRVVIVANRWYALNHHYYFRNVPRLLQRDGMPTITMVTRVEPDSVFLFGDTTMRQFFSDPHKL